MLTELSLSHPHHHDHHCGTGTASSLVSSFPSIYKPTVTTTMQVLSTIPQWQSLSRCLCCMPMGAVVVHMLECLPGSMCPEPGWAMSVCGVTSYHQHVTFYLTFTHRLVEAQFLLFQPNTNCGSLRHNLSHPLVLFNLHVLVCPLSWKSDMATIYKELNFHDYYLWWRLG